MKDLLQRNHFGEMEMGEGRFGKLSREEKNEETVIDFWM